VKEVDGAPLLRRAEERVLNDVPILHGSIDEGADRAQRGRLLRSELVVAKAAGRRSAAGEEQVATHLPAAVGQPLWMARAG
jgi:hypothetical protein